MTVESTIYSRLSGFAGLAALVSNRIEPGVLVQNTTYPAIAYRRVSTERAHAYGVDTGNVRARFQFDVYSATYASGIDVCEQLRAALQRWTTDSPTVIQGIYYKDQTDFYEDETRVYHFALDFEVNYREG